MEIINFRGLGGGWAKQRAKLVYNISFEYRQPKIELLDPGCHTVTKYMTAASAV